jgi:hypothetical protein
VFSACKREKGEAMKGKRPSAFGGRAAKEKPAAPESMEAEVPRKLTEAELYTAAKRLVTKVEVLKGLEKRKREVTSEVNKDLKTTRAEIDALSSQLATGVEMVKQGDLFVDGGVHALPKDQAADTLAELEERTSPAAEFVAQLGERNGMDDQELKRRLEDFCADKGIRGRDLRDAVWLGVQELLGREKPAGDDAPAASGEEARA